MGKEESLKKIYYSVYKNKIAPFAYYYHEDGRIFKTEWLFSDSKPDKNFIKRKHDLLENELDKYFKHELRKFGVKICRTGEKEAFTKKVLDAMEAIPLGKTLSYGELADGIGKPGAARAVGNICRQNELPLLIPCHRVVAKNGIGGYMGKNKKSSELNIKEKLLEHEKGRSGLNSTPVCLSK